MFDRFFNMDNPFWDGMGRIFDIFILNALWLACCLPVLTIGPATTAFYNAMSHLVRGDDGTMSGWFFSSMKRDFRQAMRLGVPLTITGVFLAVDVSMCYHAGRGVYTFFMAFFAVLFLLWAFVMLYAFPLLAVFHNTNTPILTSAFLLSIRHAGKTLLMLAVTAGTVWICRLIPGLLFIAPGLACEVHCVCFSGIFKPYMPQKPAEATFRPLTFADVDKPEASASEAEHETACGQDRRHG